MDSMKDLSRDGFTVQKYVDVLSDAGFKAVFGTKRNKDILIHFLNLILPGHRKVKDLEYSSTEIPSFALSTKTVRLDLRCTGQDGTKFIVEMQQSAQEHFFKRCVEYAAKVYDSGSRRGDSERYDIPPVYFIAILGKQKMFDRDETKWEGRFLSRYNFREDIILEFAEETISINFVELNRFNKNLEDCKDDTEKWFYALKHINELDDIPESLDLQPFRRLFEACETENFTVEQKLQYEHDMITERDYKNIMETARKLGFASGFAEGKEDGFNKGLAEGKIEGLVKGHAEGQAEGHAEGHAEGLAEGSREATLRIARSMIAAGIERSLVSSVTDLSLKELEELE